MTMPNLETAEEFLARLLDHPQGTLREVLTASSRASLIKERDAAVRAEALQESRAAEARLREALAEAIAHLHPSEPLRQRMVAALSASDGGGGRGDG